MKYQLYLYDIYKIGVISLILFFFFNDTATTEIYTLSLHDALPISIALREAWRRDESGGPCDSFRQTDPRQRRSEEHTSELQSLAYLVCRLLLEKKKNKSLPHVLMIIV